MITWFKGLPLVAKLIGGAVALALGFFLITQVVGCVKDSEDEENANYVEQGVTQERSHAQGEVLNSVQNANDARDRPDPALEQRVCDRYDRNCPKDNQ